MTERRKLAQSQSDLPVKHSYKNQGWKTGPKPPTWLSGDRGHSWPAECKPETNRPLPTAGYQALVELRGVAIAHANYRIPNVCCLVWYTYESWFQKGGWGEGGGGEGWSEE